MVRLLRHPWRPTVIGALLVIPLAIISAPVPAAVQAAQKSSDQHLLALRGVLALQVLPGEHALIRFDPNADNGFAPEIEKLIRAAGATAEMLPWGPDPRYAERIARTDIVVWGAEGATPEPREQAQTLLRVMDTTSRIRQLHFHSVPFGTRELDGLPGQHLAEYDAKYRASLDVDYRGLRAQMDKAVTKFRAGEIRVTTPAGTDLRFRVGNREFNYQDGAISRDALKLAGTRANRERELHPGGLRVAPIEESANGVIVLPYARFGRPRTGRALLAEPGVRATGIRLEIKDGVIVKAHAETEDEALQAFLKSDPAAVRFREFALGFNPALTLPKGAKVALQHGYGGGVVRLSLGENAEHGGAVKGGVVRWFLFADSTVTAAGETLVQDGRIVMH